MSFNFPHYVELTEQHELVQLYGELIDNRKNNDYKFIEKINSTIDIKNVKAVNIMKKLVNTLIYTIIITAIIITLIIITLIIIILIIIYLLPPYCSKSKNIIRSATKS